MKKIFFAALIAIIAVGVNVTPNNPISSAPVVEANSFPRTPAEVMSIWNVVADPGETVQIVKEGRNGWEVHCLQFGCDLWVTGPVCMDVDSATSMVEGMLGFDYTVYAQYSPQWGRLQVQAGQTVKHWGYQVSIYAFFCAPAPGQTPSNAQVVPAEYSQVTNVTVGAQAPAVTNVATTQAAAPAATNNCVTSAQDAATRVGGNTSEWSPIPGTNNIGWLFRSFNKTTLNVPVEHVLDHSGGRATGPTSVQAAEASLYCRHNP